MSGERDYAALLAENERLREALQHIGGIARCCGCSDDWRAMHDIAVAALAAAPEECGPEDQAKGFAEKPYPTGRTLSGREVVVCYCGGDPHEWRPHGGGARILACFPEAPIRKPEPAAVPEERG